MSKKTFVKSSSDDVVEQFRAGLEAWEHPRRDNGEDARESESLTKTETIRARGTARVNQRLTAGETNASPLEADDHLVERFRQGLARWERPFETGAENE